MRVATRLKAAQNAMQQIAQTLPALPTQNEAGQPLLRKFLRRPRKKKATSILDVVVFDGETPERCVSAPAFFEMPSRVLGMSVKKRVYPLSATEEYLFIDVSAPSASKSDCLPAVIGPSFAVPVPRSRERRPAAELLGDVLPYRHYGESSQPAKTSGQLVRKSARAETSLDHDRLVRRVPTLPIISLLRLWQNALRYSAEGTPDKGRRAAALRVIIAVEAEWSNRGLDQGLCEQAFAWPTTDAPKRKGPALAGFEGGEDGMLSYLEYRVGKTNGQPRRVRRAILDRVFYGKLPPGLSKAIYGSMGAAGER